MLIVWFQRSKKKKSSLLKLFAHVETHKEIAMTETKKTPERAEETFGDETLLDRQGFGLGGTFCF